MVPQCYMLLCTCVYGLQRYGHLYNSCPLCFLLSIVLLLKQNIDKIDVTVVFDWGDCVATCLGKSCSFGLLCVSCTSICRFVCLLVRVGCGI